MTQDPEERPIRGLADLESEVSPQFVGVVRKKIQRRSAAAQFAQFSWTFPRIVLVELLNIMAHLMAVLDGRKGKSQ